MPKASEKTAKYLGKPKAKERARPRLISDYPLQSITIAGFKSIRDKTTLSLAGLNVIAGANSAGKSSFMQPLLLLKQTLEAGFDPGPLLLDGPHVRFTELSQFLSKPKRGQPDQLSIDLGFSPDKSIPHAINALTGLKKQATKKVPISVFLTGEVLSKGRLAPIDFLSPTLKKD